MYDVVIRNGLVVDGNGGEPVSADVAINGDTIAAIGEISESGKQEIDAAGHIVTPGFVDVHTHLDAQIGWDPQLTPISWHGVTTALLGNCGVTFAPCKPNDREFLAGMMETVEDIPRDAIMSGLSWNWEHYGEYLDELEKLDPAINVAGMIGHCALRYYVMGERSIDEQPTEEEKQGMAGIVKQAVADGAVGFSTSRFLGHYIPDGRHVPGTHAEHDELEVIAKVVGEQGALMQNVTNFGGDFDGEMELIRKEADNSRVLFSHGTGRSSTYGDKVEQRIMAMREQGLDVNAIAIPRSSGFVTGLQAYLPWRGGAWSELFDLGFDARVAAIKDPEFVARLVERAKEKGPLISEDMIFYLGDGDKPNYVGGPDESLQAVAAANGEHPSETFIRISNETEGKALFTLRFFNQNMDALAEAISSEFCIPSLGDAGAHVSQIMDSGWATFVMTHWHRDSGLFSLPEAVKRITSVPARIIGLKDRGALEVGKKADVNVIELESLSERMPEIVHDFPGGAPRFIQKAKGYRATLCNGQVILENDELTGARSGNVLRHAG
ncbi:MAG: amidohydrolase family protein [Pseudomonadales bacterium]|nr:amidohydrolase family protein [Pseudomonadales bacterium]